LFDRICREKGIKHLLTKPRSPTTTGKVERWHKTLRVEFLTGRVFNDVADAKAQLDAWVEHYKQTAGLHRRARGTSTAPLRATASAVSVTRKVDSSGNVSFAGSHYRAGNAYRRRQVQVAVVGDHVELSIGEELIRRHETTRSRKIPLGGLLLYPHWV
jgi:hypothetical protein